MKNSIEASKQDEKRRTAELSRFKDTIGEMKSQVAAYAAENAAMKQSVEASSQDEDRRNKELSVLRSTIDEMKSQVAAYAAENAALSEQIDNLERKGASAGADTAVWQSRCIKAEHALEQSKIESESLRNEVGFFHFQLIMHSLKA